MSYVKIHSNSSMMFNFFGVLTGCRSGVLKSPIIQSSFQSHSESSIWFVVFEVLWMGLDKLFFRHHFYEWHTTRSRHGHDVFQLNLAEMSMQYHV